MRWLSGLLCFLVAAGFSPGAIAKSKFVDSDTKILLPIIWALDPADSAKKIASDTFSDPLLFGMNVVAALSDANVRRDAASVAIIIAKFDQLMERRSESGYWPHPAYDPFPDGWYSGMDFASTALAALSLHEVTGTDRFLDQGTELINQMIKPVANGGAMHRTDLAQCWLGEFVWPGMAQSGQNYVLNGFLYALQALAVFSKRDAGNDAFRSAYDCAIKSYKSISNEYIFKDGSWLYYMLNDPITNQAHYLIYETVQFDALYALVGDRFFLEQAEVRRRIFGGNYGIFGDRKRFFFSRLGAPHPFRPDIYQTVLEFRDRNGVFLGSATSPITKEFNYFMEGPLPSDAVSVSVFARSGQSQVKMATADIRQPSEADLEELSYSVSPIFSIEPEGEEWRIYGDARLVLDLPKPTPRKVFDIFTLDLELTANTAWAIGLWDPQGHETFRYLPAMARDDRVIVPLSRLGFVKPDEMPDTISKIVLYFYPTKPARIRLNSIVSYPDWFKFGKSAEKKGVDTLFLETD